MKQLIKDFIEDLKKWNEKDDLTIGSASRLTDIVINFLKDFDDEEEDEECCSHDFIYTGTEKQLEDFGFMGYEHYYWEGYDKVIRDGCSLCIITKYKVPSNDICIPVRTFFVDGEGVAMDEKVKFAYLADLFDAGLVKIEVKEHTKY